MLTYNYLRTVRRSVLLKNHSEYLKSDNWDELRKQVLKRDNYMCTICGASDCKLDVHHKTYKRHENERLSDLTTLCATCHLKFHHKT